MIYTGLGIVGEGEGGMRMLTGGEPGRERVESVFNQNLDDYQGDSSE